MVDGAAGRKGGRTDTRKSAQEDGPDPYESIEARKRRAREIARQLLGMARGRKRTDTHKMAERIRVKVGNERQMVVINQTQSVMLYSSSATHLIRMKDNNKSTYRA